MDIVEEVHLAIKLTHNWSYFQNSIHDMVLIIVVQLHIYIEF